MMSFRLKDFTIMQTIITAITVILAVSVTIALLSSYNIVTATSKELVYDQASEINKQIVFNYENYTNRVEDVANLLQKEVFEYDVDLDKDVIGELLTTSQELEDSIVALTLFTNNGEVIVGTQPIRKNNNDIAVKEWYMNALFDEKIIHFTSPHVQDIYDVLVGDVISASKVFDYYEGGIQKKGILLVDMNFGGLDALSQFTNLGPEGHILILDSDDNIVYASDATNYGYDSKSYAIVLDKIFGSTTTAIDGNQMVVNINPISSTRWRIATFQDVNTIEYGMRRALYVAVGLIIVTMLITILVAYLVAKQITNPLKKLNKAIVKFHHGNYESKVEIQGQKEITIVTTAFNEMIDKIQHLMDEVVVEQEGKRKTEIRALQNQINPHFLYNTLDCMIWLAEQNRNEDLVETVSALSTYFRVSLSKGKQFIPIAEEIKHIESYMMIQRMRYNNVFTYSVDCEASIAQLRIMKLILQPLVENAIYHGIDKDDQDSYIKIMVKDLGDTVMLSVINSGYGISEDKIEEIYRVMKEGNKKGSVGMKNVYSRIKLFYGDGAKLTITSELDEHTTISLCINKAMLEVD